MNVITGTGIKRPAARFRLLVFALAALLGLRASAQFQGRIEGVVVDSAGTPIEKANVMIISQKSATISYRVTTDKNGKFSQIGLMPGTFQVSVNKPGFAPRTLEVKVSVSESTKIEVRLEKAEEIVDRSVSAADKLLLKGNKLFEEKKYAEAAAAYEEAIKLGQNQWSYYLNLGLAYKKAEKKEEAGAAFRKARELNPEAYSTNKELGEWLAKAGNFAEAKKYYQKAVELSSDDPDAQYNLGVCQISSGEGEAAMASFAKTVELKPDYADAYYQLGTLYINQNKVKEATENLEKFLQLAPNHEKAAVARQLVDFLKKK
jgi:tetratricopeptide (TPR) repeat protein